MRSPKFRLAALALTSGLVLSGCAYGMYGDPYGYGYGPQSGVSIGVGYGGGYGGYYGGYGYGYPYAGYGYGYGYGDPFGWYGDYYYPGAGVFVFDSSRHRHRWNGDQQRYWTSRRTQWACQSPMLRNSGAMPRGWRPSRITLIGGSSSSGAISRPAVNATMAELAATMFQARSTATAG